MKANEVRHINVGYECCWVYFLLKNGKKTIVRKMEASEIKAADKLLKTEGKAAQITEYVRLFNEKYSEPQELKYVDRLTASERRFFELHQMNSLGILTPDEEDEYYELLDE